MNGTDVTVGINATSLTPFRTCFIALTGNPLKLHGQRVITLHDLRVKTVEWLNTLLPFFFFFPWAILSAKLWQTSHEVWHLKQNTTHCSSTKKVQVLKKFKRKKNLCILVEFLYLQWFWSMLGTLCLLSLICQLNILSMRKKKPKTCCETCQGFLVLTYKYLRWHR